MATVEMKRFGFAIIGLAALGLAGCSESSAPIEDYPDLILGDWECQGTMKEGAMKGSYLVDVTYEENGTSRADGRFDISGEGLNISINMDIVADWEISGKLLTDTLISMDVSLLDMSGDAVTPETRKLYEQNVIEGLQSDEEFQPGELTYTSIDLLNETTLKITELEEGEQSTCTRKA